MEQQSLLIIPSRDELPIALLARCGGYYDCPVGADGKTKGPLVGYAARYDGVHQWVGLTYVNFAKAEEHPPVVRRYSELLARKASWLEDRDCVFCGVPEGGKAFAYDLAAYCGRRHSFAEKEVLAVKTDTSREKSRIVFKRHQPRKGDRLVIVEDVCNNFDATDQIIAEVEKAGAEVVAIACFLNRSLKYDAIYETNGIGDSRRGFPITSVVRKPIREYEQDDPVVAAEVARNNVVWKPKDEWDRLMTAMETAK